MGLIKILHTADLHLGAGSTVGGKKRVEDILNSFKRVTEIALREEVDILLIAGDIFHTPRPSSNIFYSFAELTKRLFEKGVRIVAAAGNHDVPKSAEERSLIEALAEYSEGRFLFFKKPGVATITVKGSKTVAVVALPYLNPIQFILPDRVEESRYRRIVREKVAKLLEEIDADYKILLGHLMMEWA
ncbi:MAG TPA: DNA repair exonuclease, partial [Thermoprotei archaeon]|nr:DNA repair exonuclease [Thermoprotei archaeon]